MVATLCYINLWADKQQEIATTTFKKADEAVEDVAAEYPDLRYIGTVIVERDGPRAPEDWTELARKYREDATQDWLEEQRERQAHRQKVL